MSLNDVQDLPYWYTYLGDVCDAIGIYNVESGIDKEETVVSTLLTGSAVHWQAQEVEGGRKSAAI